MFLKGSVQEEGVGGGRAGREHGRGVRRPLPSAHSLAGRPAGRAPPHFVAPMPKKRVLSPQSAWDEAAVTAAVLGAGGKAMHVDAVYRRGAVREGWGGVWTGWG